MERRTKTWVGKLTSSSSTSPAIQLRDDMSACKMYFPSGYTSTTATFYSLDPSTSTYLQEYTDAGSALSITVTAGAAIPLPDQLFASTHIKIVTGSDDSDKDVGVVIRA
jgi:hypothetical protein